MKKSIDNSIEIDYTYIRVISDAHRFHLRDHSLNTAKARIHTARIPGRVKVNRSVV
jgi:hypothetical protein